MPKVEQTSLGSENQPAKILETSPHKHSPGWVCCLDTLKELAARIKTGACTVIQTKRGTGNLLSPLPMLTAAFLTDQWCLTHATEADYGHQQSVERKRRDA